MLRCSDVIRVLDESPLSNLLELAVVLYLATCSDRPTSSVSQGRLKFLFASAPFPVHSVPLVLPSAFFHCPFTPLLSVAGRPPSCLSLPPQPLDICFISATVSTPLVALPYLPDRSLNYINRICWCRRQFGGYSGLLAPAER